MAIGLVRAQELKGAILAAQCAKDLEGVRRLFECARDELVWSPALSDRIGDLRQIISSVPPSTFPEDEYMEDLAAEINQKFEEDLWVTPENMIERWYTEPPLPSVETVHLTFRDATADHKAFGALEIWADEEVESIIDGAVLDTLLRFRIRANKKYRHPYRPSLDFDILLPKAEGAESELINIDNLDEYLVQTILARLGDTKVIKYVRNDDQNGEAQFYVENTDPWARTLPDWLSPAPPTWCRYTPPVSYTRAASRTAADGIQYKEVPLLYFGGTGRDILPSITMPPLVVSHVYLPVQHREGDYCHALGDEVDHVVSADRLVPPLTDAQARSLLGRAIQFSTAPLPEPRDDNRPQKKRKKTRPLYTTLQTVVVWGYDPATSLLSCTSPFGLRNTDFVLDLRVADREVIAADKQEDPYGVTRKFAHWLGVVSSPQDRKLREERAMGTAAISVQAQDENPEEVADIPEENDGTLIPIEGLVMRLNIDDTTRIFEVLVKDRMLLGDATLATVHGGLDFDVTVDGLKPGIWHSLVDDDGEVELLWARPGHVDYEDPEPLEDDQMSTPFSMEDDSRWAELGVYGVDSGISGAIMQSVFVEDGVLTSDEGGTRDVMDVLTKQAFEELGSEFIAVPGGIVWSGQDGTYVVRGHKDDDGLLVAITIRVEEGRVPPLNLRMPKNL
ncbi:predicted protein [Postia placenta Mad-698-R]|uniref:Uncharacterized protein n=1 Tax=Postia placenta MAD-698-R-SB12 TaxID=670580 RepID=A0A1X6N185_9APHY|nr:hypothetical protein POSPLADRAFT_1142350 [Postia placenta MAD-698-R-SB12]EED83302.1 predicted protein [Postia placenta Mad-698-R]OSX62377.1 hypothetical protein POSPLADRAFT_1142350 [Postia placenta MAD-698-R-SB12]